MELSPEAVTVPNEERNERIDTLADPEPRRLDLKMTVHQMSDTSSTAGCCHSPACPSVEATDREAAHVVAAHPEQGWSLLCNGIVLFEDFGELLPNGTSVAARRRELIAASPHRQAS